MNTNTSLPPTIQYDNGLESNIYNIAQQICGSPARPPCTIQLIMAHEIDPEVIFDILSEYTKSCLHILYGAQASPLTLTTQQFELLEAYVHSIGYRLIVNREETETVYKFKISFEPYQSVKPNPFQHLQSYMHPK